MPLLEVQNLKKYFATQKAVDDISFSVNKGSIFGLLGPNGAGKTTLIRMITGIFYPDEGQILFDGRKFDPINDVVHIGYMPEERGLYKKMKIGEQAVYLAQLKGLKKSEAMAKIKEWFIKFEMQSWWTKKVEDLSKGMSQKLQFVTTVLHEPKLIILDEPFSGLDPVNSNLIKDEIFKLAQRGSTILFSTHRMEQVEEICDHIILVNKGKKMRGYYTNDAVIVATESRTSSPVRIPRNAETLQHPQIQNLYPCGEGAGYAGGIVSAAIDGERVALSIVETQLANQF